MSSKKRWQIVVVVAVLVGGVLLFRGRGEGGGDEQGEAAAIETADVKRGEIKATVVATGTIEPETSVEVKANAGGEVTSLLVDVGDAVKKGDLIATIDPEDSQTAVHTAAADLDAAMANVSQARAAAAQERHNLPSRIDNAVAAVRVARARLRQAEENLAVAKRTTVAEVTTAAAGLTAAEARVSSAGTSQTIDTTLYDTELVTAYKQQAEAAARLKQAEFNLELQTSQYQTGLQRAREARTAAVARLESARLQSETRPVTASAQVRESEASLVAARERLNRLNASAQPAEAASAQGDYEAAKATLALAEADLKRQRELFDKGFVALQTVEQQQVTVASARSRFDTAQKTWETLKSGQSAELAEAKAAVLQAEASLERAKSSERESRTSGYDLTAAQASLQQAEADLQDAQMQSKQVDLSRQDLETAKSALARAEEATRAAKARVQNVDIRATAVVEAQAARRQAQANRDQAEANRRQVSIRQAEVEASRAQLKQAEASLVQATAEHYTVAQRDSSVRSSQASIARRQAELRNAQEQLKDTIIRAPRDGVVIERFVEEGTIITSGRSSVSEGTKIVTLADVTQLYCLAEVDESNIGQVQPGQDATLTVEAFEDQEFQARVRKVYPRGVVESDVTMFTVELAVLPTKMALRPGMTAEIEILSQVHPNVLLVPAEAVSEGPKGFVVQVLKNGVPTETEVETGIQSVEQVEVTKGVAEGDKVVLSSGGNGDEEKGGGSGKGGSSDKQRDFNRSMKRGIEGMKGGSR